MVYAISGLTLKQEIDISTVIMTPNAHNSMKIKEDKDSYMTFLKENDLNLLVGVMYAKVTNRLIELLISIFRESCN
jgi:hypothetical protein